MALFIAAAACPYLLPKPAVKPLQRVFILIVFPLVGDNTALRWSSFIFRPLRLIGLKNIFARQLPNMPKEYIVRLVMDRYFLSRSLLLAECKRVKNVTNSCFLLPTEES
ncbi:hypothetical protein ACSBR2_037518 [Camellia fascicularis]